MKRLFFILFFFSVIFFCSCQRQDDILEYQDKGISAECLVNGEYRILLQKNQSSTTLTVKEPQEADGISFVIGDTVNAVFNETSITIDKESLKGIYALSQIFSQSKEQLINAVSSDEGSILSFSDGECLYQITLGKNSLPKLVQISSQSFEYSVEILSIELT